LGGEKKNENKKVLPIYQIGNIKLDFDEGNYADMTKSCGPSANFFDTGKYDVGIYRGDEFVRAGSNNDGAIRVKCIEEDDRRMEKEDIISYTFKVIFVNYGFFDEDIKLINIEVEGGYVAPPNKVIKELENKILKELENEILKQIEEINKNEKDIILGVNNEIEKKNSKIKKEKNNKKAIIKGKISNTFKGLRVNACNTTLALAFTCKNPKTNKEKKSCLVSFRNEQKNSADGRKCKKNINKVLASFPAITSSFSSLRDAANFTSTKLDRGISSERNIKRLIIDWTNFILPFAAIIAVIALVWAGFIYITAMEDEGRIDTAKNIIKGVVIGLLLVGAAYAIGATVNSGAST
jgi:hypothetical protein